MYPVWLEWENGRKRIYDIHADYTSAEIEKGWGNDGAIKVIGRHLLPEGVIVLSEDRMGNYYFSTRMNINDDKIWIETLNPKSLWEEIVPHITTTLEGKEHFRSIFADPVFDEDDIGLAEIFMEEIDDERSKRST